MAEGMPGGLDRRELLIGGLSIAGAATLLAKAEAAPPPDEEIVGIAATVVAAPSRTAADVVVPGAKDRSRVVLEPAATVMRDGLLTDFRPGDQLFAFGDTQTDGTFRAFEVVRAVFGQQADALQRSAA
jgi:hypothetical protein